MTWGKIVKAAFSSLQHLQLLEVSHLKSKLMKTFLQKQNNSGIFAMEEMGQPVGCYGQK